MIEHYDGQDYCLRCGGPANTFSCPECDGAEYTGHYWTPSEIVDPCWEYDEKYNPPPWYDRLYHCWYGHWWYDYMGMKDRLVQHWERWGLRLDKYVMWRWRQKHEEDMPF